MKDVPQYTRSLGPFYITHKSYGKGTCRVFENDGEVIVARVLRGEFKKPNGTTYHAGDTIQMLLERCRMSRAKTCKAQQEEFDNRLGERGEAVSGHALKGCKVYRKGYSRPDYDGYGDAANCQWGMAARRMPSENFYHYWHKAGARNNRYAK